MTKEVKLEKMRATLKILLQGSKESLESLQLRREIHKVEHEEEITE